MKRIILTLVLAALTTPALASRGTAPAASTFINDVAAAHAYEPDVAPVGHHLYHRHHVEHERKVRHHSVMGRSPTTGGKTQPPVATVTQPEVAQDGLLGEIARSVQGLADAINLDVDRLYLVATACPGGTMSRQGAMVAIGRLNPIFVRRLAATNREAHEHGMAPCIYSAYRPPAFDVGGFHDKFRSAHTYGLATDEKGIGDPGSNETILYRKIAAKHGVYCPYSYRSNAEWNHCQPTRELLVADAAPLRSTVTAYGPKSLERMWKVGEAIIAPEGRTPNIAIGHVRRVHHYAHHHYRHYAGA